MHKSVCYVMQNRMFKCKFMHTQFILVRSPRPTSSPQATPEISNPLFLFKPGTREAFTLQVLRTRVHLTTHRFYNGFTCKPLQPQVLQRDHLQPFNHKFCGLTCNLWRFRKPLNAPPHFCKITILFFKHKLQNSLYQLEDLIICSLYELIVINT